MQAAQTAFAEFQGPSFVQTAEEGTGGMDLILTHKEMLNKNLKVEKDLGEGSRNVWVLYCTRIVQFSRFTETTGWIFWEDILKEKEVQKNWQILKQTPLKTQRQRSLPQRENTWHDSLKNLHI